MFVLALTFIVFGMGWSMTSHGPIQLIQDYTKDFWRLLTFAMQLGVLLISGFVVADSKLIKSIIVKLVDWPKTAKSTVVMFVAVAGATSWLHWGVWLIREF